MDLQKLIDGLKAHKNGAASYESVDEAIRVFEAMRDVDGEKVVKGLKCLISAGKHCENCEYDEHGLCGSDLIVEDALALIRQQHGRIAELEVAQTARVMTLEEVKRLLPGADVWIEYHDLTGWKIAAITVREIFDNGLLGELQSLRYGFDRYGRYNGDWLAWRCWTQRPTDEQREVTPWY